MALVAIALAATKEPSQTTLSTSSTTTETPAKLTGDTEVLAKDRRRHGRLLKNILIAKIPSPQMGMMMSMPKAILTAGIAMKNSAGICSLHRKSLFIVLS